MEVTGRLLTPRLIWIWSLVFLCSGTSVLSGQTSIPSFDLQPERQILRTGDTLELEISLAGYEEAPIQWFYNGELLEGETALKLIILDVDVEDGGKYFATATHGEGTAYTDHARISVRLWNLDKSVARQWMEELLDAIRLDYPAPTVHSRNLLSLSTAMWDAWAAYDTTGVAVPYIAEENLDFSLFLDDDTTMWDTWVDYDFTWGVAVPYLVEENLDPSLNIFNEAAILAARNEAISYAAYRVLRSRFRLSPNVEITAPSLTERFEILGFDPDNISVDGNSPAAVGNRIAAKTLAFGWSDGSNERYVYRDQTGYKPLNTVPLVFEFPGVTIADPNRWQPLAFDHLVLQNGIVIGQAIQTFLGPNWGWVTPFALTRENEDDVYSDPGPPPYLGGEGDQVFKDAAVEVIEFSSWLDPSDGVMIDVSPKSRHNNTLGTNDGEGYPLNPYTGEPYEENLVLRADYGRILAEFWADGPDSETPPGHWNSVAHYVSDHELFEKRFEGEGDPLGDLEWDVKLYLAMNGAVSDSAIACWDAKRKYDYIRPITMIRYMGGKGQSSDPDGPSYDIEGLPLSPGLVELITLESTADGERHEHLQGHEGDIAVYAWQGIPENGNTEYGGVGWIRAVEWMPYQRDTFVTPPFGAYTSGHSTFSRAGAEVLTAITADSYFPGGISSFTAAANEFLEFENGPEEDITLTWATYFDAADEAGISRLYGGIHVWADDLRGRVMGSDIGKAAFAKAKTYFNGSATTQDWEVVYADWVDVMIEDPDQPIDPEAYQGNELALLADHFLRDLSLVDATPETRLKLVYGREGGRTTIGVECYINVAEIPHKIILEVSTDMNEWITIPEEDTYTYREPLEVYQQKVSLFVRQNKIPFDTKFLRVRIEEF